MQQASTRQRILLYLYSTPNIVGSVLGLVGLLLYVTGIIQDFWLLIVVGLYAIGVLATPRNVALDLRLQGQLDADALRNELEQLVASIRKRVPPDLLAKVISIKESIVSILPQLMAARSDDYNSYVIRQTALEYLPDALENYLNLPPAYANLHPVRNGKTARALLSEQLDLLDASMKQIVEDIHADDMQKLLVHGRFLEQKFYKGDILGAEKVGVMVG